MKRLSIILLAISFVGAFAGSVAAQALDGTLKKIQSTGVIRVGYRESSAPFSFMGPEGKPVGYSMDLCDRVVRAVQAELKLATSGAPVRAGDGGESRRPGHQRRSGY